MLYAALKLNKSAKTTLQRASRLLGEESSFEFGFFTVPCSNFLLAEQKGKVRLGTLEYLGGVGYTTRRQRPSGLFCSSLALVYDH